MRPMPTALKPIAGFESTDYAYSGETVVWTGIDPSVRHPRNYWKPWQPTPQRYEHAALQAGAVQCLALMQTDLADPTAPPALQPKGLLHWLTGQPLPFPLNFAKPRLEALRTALQQQDAAQLEQAMQRLLGLGHGLTPSGDDLLGGIFFVWARTAYPDWLGGHDALKANISKACGQATNPISHALLQSNMNGASYGQLHDALDALAAAKVPAILASMQALWQLGSSSGADLLAGMLLALVPSKAACGTPDAALSAHDFL